MSKNRITAIIIEDEKPARNELLELLEDFTEINIIDQAVNGIEAVEKISSLKPDLIFLDIQLPGLNGFEVINQINKSINKKDFPFIIFTTAFDEFALKAFESNSIDYLLKPIEPEKLKRAINKLNNLILNSRLLHSKLKNGNENCSIKFENQDNSSSFKNIQKIVDYMLEKDSTGKENENNNEKISKINIKIGDEIIFINVEDIFFIKADNKYTEIYTFDSTHLTLKSLTNYELILPQNFIKANRGTIINMDKVNMLKKWFAGKYIAIMKDKEKTQVTLNKEAKEKLLKV